MGQPKLPLSATITCHLKNKKEEALPHHAHWRTLLAKREGGIGEGSGRGLKRQTLLSPTPSLIGSGRGFLLFSWVKNK